MARNAKQRKPQPPRLGDLAADAAYFAGQRVSENPAIAGGSVAFAVVMFFVGSNALFYQPFQHKDAFFATRSMEDYVAPQLPQPAVHSMDDNARSESFQIAREDGAAKPVAPRKPDPTLFDIQSALAALNIYSGNVDGLQGPKTRAAIARFQKEAGLEPTGVIDPLLIDAIRTASIPAEKVPAPLPRLKPAAKPVAKPIVKVAKPQPLPQAAVDPEPEVVEEAPAAPVETAAVQPQETGSELSVDQLLKIQAGLKSFGNDGIEVDGRIGTKTRDAVREFQTLFKLTVTGEPNGEVLRQLQEIGLVAG